jgi:uncharacterized membrane protein (Fun14 family)
LVRAAVVVGVLVLELKALADQHVAQVLEDQLRACRAEAEEPHVIADSLGLAGFDCAELGPDCALNN